MTLIVAMKCVNGVVVCADTQETYGGYRVSVNKIAPVDAGKYQVVIGGAGLGGLIDAFADDFVDAVNDWPKGLDEKAIKIRIRNLLREFHKQEVSLHPAQDKILDFIICVKAKQSSDTFLWQTDGPGVLSVQTYALIGWEIPLYKHELGRLYQPDLRIEKGVAIGIFLFSLAKATSNYIGGDTQVIIVDKNGMALREQKEVRQREEHVKEFNDVVAEILLACIDKGIDLKAFDGLIEVFGHRALELRDQYIPSISRAR